jgi:hypothetical protein
MILKGALAGFRVVEVPVSYYPRIGKSKISDTLKGTLGAADHPLDSEHYPHLRNVALAHT